MDAALDQLREEGFPVKDEDVLGNSLELSLVLPAALFGTEAAEGMKDIVDEGKKGGQNTLDYLRGKRSLGHSINKGAAKIFGW